MVSMHSHEVGGPSKELPGDFYTEFAHKCIDAGATAILGHGPHIIRPIEIYKGCPIFYCMGNFIFQEELTEYTAEDQFEKYGLTSDTSMGDMYDIRTEGHTRGLLCDRRVMEAFVPYFEIDNDKVTKIELMPIDMGVNLEYWQMGLPRPGFGMGILERLAEMSKPYGTKISIREDGIGVIEL
jgi:poly-gamma-glutamate synthesis protein (capsule biosynthesis protein)